jgi:putative transposase
VCKALRQGRKTQRCVPRITDEEARLVERIVVLAAQYGRYGYRRITAMLRQEGCQVNHKRGERIRRREGLKVPKKQLKRERLWLNDGSCIRLRPEYEDHLRSCDFMTARTADGRVLRILNIIHEYTRQCLATLVKWRTTSEDVVDQLFNLFIFKAIPEHIRSDNGPEFTAQAIRR